MKFEGPFTAKALRDAMREGALDPFALVTTDPDNVPPRPIIDVSELFVFDESEEAIGDRLKELEQTIQIENGAENIEPVSFDLLESDYSQGYSNEERADDLERTHRSEKDSDEYVPSQNINSQNQDDSEYFVPGQGLSEEELEEDLNKTVRSEDVASNELEHKKPSNRDQLAALGIAEEIERGAKKAISGISDAVSSLSAKIETNFKGKILTTLNLKIPGLSPKKKTVLSTNNASNRKNKSDIRETLFNNISQRMLSSITNKPKPGIKKYMIYKGGKSYGPYSSSEITHGFYTKKINGNLGVQKIGNQTRFSVVQFVRLYEITQKQKRLGLNKKRKPPKNFGLSFESTPEKKNSRKVKSLADRLAMTALVLCAASGIAFGGFYAYKEIYLKGNLAYQNKLTKERRSFSKYRKTAPKKQIRRLTVDKTSTAKKSTSYKSASKQKLSSKTKRKQSNLAIPKKVGGSARKSYYQSAKKTRNPGPKKVPYKTMSAKSFNSSTVAKKAQSSTILNARLSEKINKKVALGPLYYSVSSLNSCKLKCSLQVRDSSGQRLTVTFFKAAFQAILRKKAGKATFGGIVKSGGKVLILQEVR